MQFMILLSALLASLSGMIAGERAPVNAPAQVQASAVVSVVEAVAAVAVALVSAWAALAGTTPRRRPVAIRAYDVAPRLKARLSLKKSWLN